MPTYNYKSRELIAKIVYYGPGRCGKTTNLQQIHAKMRPETRSDLLSVATETDRTIYFDLLPLNLGTINGMKFMVRLFTVPGQVYYAETRKLVLRGTDGVVFCADSQDHMLDENRESLRDLKVNLQANGIDYDTIPLVLQYNKRDLPRLISEAELDATLNDRGVKAIGAIASQGVGVLETLRFVTVAVFNNIKTAASTQQPQPAKPAASRTMSTAGASMPSPMGDSFAQPPPAPTPLPPAPPQSLSSSAIPIPAPPMSSALPPLSGMPQAPMPPLPPLPQANRATRSAALENALQAAKTAGRAVAPNAMTSTMNPLGVTPPPPPVAAPINTGTMPIWNQPRNGPQNFERPAPPPAQLSPEILIDEFKSLALMHSQLAERLTTVEQEVKRLGRENQEIRERLTRHSE